MTDCDAVVVGSGPNGFAAAITLAQEGLKVWLFEERDTVGGGLRTEVFGETEGETKYLRDVCSTSHPMALTSPFFMGQDLAQHGLEWVQPEYPLAHPLDKEPPMILERSPLKTAEHFSSDSDAEKYLQLVNPFLKKYKKLMSSALKGVKIPPEHPILLAKFGMAALRSVSSQAAIFESKQARALLAGCGAHSIQPLENFFTNAIGLSLLLAAHAVGWPFARGGSRTIADALSQRFESLGGRIITGHRVTDIKELPEAQCFLFDTSPTDMVEIARRTFPSSHKTNYMRRVKNFRYGPGVYKIDFALSQAVPWRDSKCMHAGVLHLGGTIDEIALSERNIWNGKRADKPFVLVAQPTLFDTTRAPAGKHVLWAYCHVPSSSPESMANEVISQIERFAPGFRDCVVGFCEMTAKQYEDYNRNYIGGDIICGVQDLIQNFRRPASIFSPYDTPNPKVYLCSSATPPGGGVHGMCGYNAAKRALTKTFHI